MHYGYAMGTAFIVDCSHMLSTWAAVGVGMLKVPVGFLPKPWTRTLHLPDPCTAHLRTHPSCAFRLSAVVWAPQPGGNTPAACPGLVPAGAAADQRRPEGQGQCLIMMTSVESQQVCKMHCVWRASCMHTTARPSKGFSCYSDEPCMRIGVWTVC